MAEQRGNGAVDGGLADDERSGGPSPTSSAPRDSLLRGVLNSSHDGIMVFRSIRDDAGSIVDFEWLVVNPAAESVVGRTGGDLVGKRMLVEMPGNAEDGLFDQYVAVVETGEAHSAEFHYDHEGLDNWFQTTAVRVNDGFTVSFRDISNHKALQLALEHQALHDPLTGLPNRTLLEDRLGHAMNSIGRHGRSLAVLFVDIDRFKSVNDSLGHAAGDALLAELAARLTSVARASDTVARFGGDEFVVLCEGLAIEEDAATVARRMVEACSTPFSFGGRQLQVGASVGIAVTHVSDVEPMSLVRDADAAMYRAKVGGGSRVEFFDEDLRSSAKARLDIELGLRHALDNDEFRAFYQPIVETSTGRITGAEALVRWVHPERGIVSPADFLPVAEATGAIVPIGEFVLRTALTQIAEWHELLEAQSPTRVSVNLAAEQLSIPGFADQVLALLTETGVAASSLCVEVTETSLIRDPIAAEDTLRSLARHGVHTALDDFGTGYSPLTYLQRFPVNSVKIDRSFIAELGNDLSTDAVVEAVVALSHRLHKTVTAEGVETAEQLTTLTGLSADCVQGYFYSPPVPAHEFPLLVERICQARSAR